ncbi:hypothetical protein QFZ94_007504 [Paraburkholderia sp. JPY465]|uniref:hypothetical protein n=1 Tax=Paraburkholderia sp. JPY465 TaxID=3042285 RepID=UPI003D242E8D
MRLTTAYLLTLDAQDVFDIVAWHLLRQNAQATLPGTAKCMYRAPDGKRCAIGWLLPDEVYSPSLEFFGVRDLVAMLYETPHGGQFAQFLFEHMPLLRDLQGTHDARAPHEWPGALRMIAQQHSLRETVIDKAFCDDRVSTPPVPYSQRRAPSPAYLLDLSQVLAFKPASAIVVPLEPEELAW